MTMKNILIATNNVDKIREIKNIINTLSNNYRILEGIQIPDVDETGMTYKENAELKSNAALEVVKKLNLQVDFILSDDSGLEVEELNNKPGVHTARFAFINNQGRDHSIEDNISYIHKLMSSNRSKTKYVCYIDIIRVTDEVHLGSIGTLDGYIVKRKVKDFNKYFAYDPFFELLDGRILSEVSKEEKNAISHRHKAIASSIIFNKSKI